MRAQVHALAGRKLMINSLRDGKDIELHRADAQTLLRSKSTKSADARAQLYLVRTVNPAPPGLATSLRNLAAGRVYYLPHDTFLAPLEDEKLGSVSSLAGVPPNPSATARPAVPRSVARR